MPEMPTPPAERLHNLMRSGENALSLAEGALIVAQHRYPSLDVRDYLARLDASAEILRRRLPADAGRTYLISRLNHFLFDELGYAGNDDNFYDPRNSMLNDVIERRRGIPITLSIVYLEVGRRLGLPLGGVSFPGHFLVRCAADGGVFLLDPYYGGVTLSEAELRDRLARQGNAPETKEAPLGRYLQLARKSEILARLLHNLKLIYLQGSDLKAALDVISMILVASPEQTRELRDRGLIYRQLECYQAALKDLERYLELEPEARNDELLQRVLAELRGRSATLH